MNKYQLLILCGLIWYSCNTREKNIESNNDTNSANTTVDTAMIVDSLNNAAHSSDSTDVVISNGTPEITPLPFLGQEYNFVTELIKRSPKLYRLPYIKKLEYFPIYNRSSKCLEGICIDYNTPAECSEGGRVDTSVFKFKRYRFKLPDIYKYRSYIVCDTLYSSYGISVFPQARDKCFDLYITEHCYLILYDSLSQAAKVIALHHPCPSKIDNPQVRTFVIDKSYTIHIQDYGISEDGMKYEPTNYTFDIRILPQDEIEIEKLMRIK